MTLCYSEAAKLENDAYYDRFCVLRKTMSILEAWRQAEAEFMAVNDRAKYGPGRYESFLKFYKRRDARNKRSKLAGKSTVSQQAIL